MQTYSTSQFEIRIKDGLLEMRIEGIRTPGMSADAARAFESLFRSAPVTAVAFDIRAIDLRISRVDLESRSRHFARQCRGLPVAMIGRGDQQEQMRIAIGVVDRMNGTARAFRSREKAHAWLRSVRQPA